MLGVMACTPTSPPLPERDAWEGVRPDGICRKSEDLPFLVVPNGNRAKAIALLERDESVALETARASELAGAEAEYGDQFTAPTVVAHSIAKLTKERNQGTQLIVLERLQLRKDLAQFRPFLVRGTAKFEEIGAFSVRTCDMALLVSHISLGEYMPKSTRVPLIVFLPEAPQRVFMSTGVAR
jgi:hypothetical protein